MATKILSAGVLLGLLFCAVSIRSDALEEAKKLMAEKRYSEVDKALEKELAEAKPAPEVLKLSYDAAMADSRFVSAERRISALLKVTQNKDAELLYLGALSADRIGDQQMASGRYALFVQAVGDKAAAAPDKAGGDPRLQAALSYILMRGTYPGEYKKYVQLFGADGGAWSFGATQLDRLCAAIDPERALDIAAFLINSFPEPSKVNYVHWRLRVASENFELGKDPKDRFLKPLQLMITAAPTDYSNLYWMFDNARNSGSLLPQERFAIAVKVQNLVKQPLRGSFSDCLYDIREIKDTGQMQAAAKDILALEPKYKDSPNRDDYYFYLSLLGQLPTIFTIPIEKDKAPLVSPQAAMEKVEILKQKYADNLPALGQIIAWFQGSYIAGEARADFLKKNIGIMPPNLLNDLVAINKFQNISATIAEFSKGRSYKDILDAKVNLMGSINQSKDPDAPQLMMDIAKEYMAAYAGSYNWQHIRGHFINSPLLNADQKLAVLKEQVGLAGYSKIRSELLKNMAEDKQNWATNPGFLELIKAHNAKAPGTDLMMRFNVEIFGAVDPKQTVDVAQKFLQEYKGQIPGGPEKTTSLESLQALNVYGKVAEISWNNGDYIAALAEAWAPRMGMGSNWDSLARRVREHGRNGVLQKILPAFVALMKDNPGWPGLWDSFCCATCAKDDFTNPLADCYAKMGTEYAVRHVQQNWESWKSNPKFYMEQLEKALIGTGCNFGSKDMAYGLMSHLYHNSGPQMKVSPEITKALWTWLQADQAKSGVFSPYYEQMCYMQQARSGNDVAPMVAAYMADVDKRNEQQQLEAFATLINSGALPDEQANTQLKPGMRCHTTLKKYRPALDKVPLATLVRMPVNQNLYLGVEGIARNWTDAAIQGEAEGIGARLQATLANGAGFDGDPRNMQGMIDWLCRRAVEQERWQDVMDIMSRYAILLARCSDWNDNYARISPLIKLLEEKKMNEIIYAFISSVERLSKPSEKAMSQLAVIKAKAGADIKDMISVDKSDPLYNLFLAAQALGAGGEDRAWELTSPKLQLLQKEWAKFDADYVAWAVDQMRKQKMYSPALEFAMTILLFEKDLSPEIAAKICLTKGDIYRDMSNFQAAKIEYDGLRNNPRYNSTAAGSKGIWRLLDLLITTKDYMTATSLLERLADSDNIETQAEAYYYFAKMAYQEQQYKEAKEYIKKVKDRVVSHVEAAFLEGELNLVLAGGLQNTEVMVGNPRLALTAIPGRVLTLKLQDQNLSVARGGAAIPVAITTSKGQDEEHVKLMPSPTSRNLFVGQINTALGEVKKNDTLLQLRGDDIVSYEIEKDFQKAHDLNYPPKKLEVRYDAKLSASSGEILTEEEEEKRAMDRQLRRAQQTDDTSRYDLQRDNRTVRPGSPIYVQVTDFAADMTDAPDQISVDLKTSSGDVLEGFKLTENGPHTGIFRATVPTGIPLTKATTSDGAEGKDPACLINVNLKDAWTSLNDGVKPKWIEIDTMSSQKIKTCWLDVPNSAAIKQIRLLGMLADNYEELASFPAGQGDGKGGLLVEWASDQRGDTPEQIRRYLNLAGGKPVRQDKTALDRDDSPFKGRDGWQTSRMTGTFWMPEAKALELKFLQEPCPHGGWQHSYLFIDGQPVLGGAIDANTVRITKKIDLIKGPHKIDVLDRCHWNKGKVIVGYRKDDGTFDPLPQEWFSTKDNKDLADYLKPKGRILMEDKKISAILSPSVRLRKLRWEFEDFSGNSVTVNKVHLVDSEDRVLLPTANDFSSGLTNSMLEIAPGDQITVSYRDDRRLRDDTPVLESALNASFFNGKIELTNEKISNRPNSQERIYEYFQAKRCRSGDQMMIIVTDYDGDISNERDTIPVDISTSSGEKLQVKALETDPHNPAWDERSRHSGVFMAVLKTGAETKGDQIKVNTGDQLTASYIDAENTNPGVPVERVYTINEAGSGKPEFLVYKTSLKQVIDVSDEAKAKLRRMKAKDAETAVIYRDVTVATHPDYVAADDKSAKGGKPAANVAKTGAAAKPDDAAKSGEGKPGEGAPKAAGTGKPGEAGETTAAVNAPLLFEVNYPKMALNSGSLLKIEAVADSEVKAAKEGGREPTVLSVPMQVMGIDALADAKGYPLLLQSHIRRNAEEMLRDGSFAGVIRLQIGSHGDPINDLVIRGEKAFAAKEQIQQDKEGLAYKVPTMIVSGSDVVTLKVKDEAGQPLSETRVRLLSDGRIELLDSSYQIQKEAVHLGDKFFIKVTDPDRDVSNERDNISVDVKASSGDALKIQLSETLAHSGVFTGSLKPEFIGEAGPDGKKPAPNKGDDVLSVDFGDEVLFTYEDPVSLSGQPMKVEVSGKIFHGADAELSSFSKQFKDPEMAVKTNFLMAEALFEMAKEHRKLKQMDLAKEEIDRGKRILEEAMRDYPNTTLVAQGEFLLANLAQELDNYQEAIGRYSHVISTWPESEFAARAQFKKAICLEKMEQYEQACEEYVKVTYIYPESSLVADSTVRLGNYYYKKEAYKTAGQIFFRFQQRNPTHQLAAKALFLAAQCYYKMKDYKESIKMFSMIVEDYTDQKEVREEAMYWLGDSYFSSGEMVKAYQTFKKLTWDYPEGRWAKIARGRLTEEAFARIEEEGR